MATTKITITLPADQLRSIRSLVEAGQAANVSAFVKHAVDIALSDAAGRSDTDSPGKELADAILSPTAGGGPRKR